MIWIIITGVLTFAGGIGGLIFFIRGKSASSGALLERLEQEKKDRVALIAEASTLKESLLEFEALVDPAQRAAFAQDAVRVERGRVTITQAELETVEARLREIDEIERELEASNVEAQEELKVLQKKENALNNKNAQLKDQIATSTQELDRIIGSIQENSELAIKVSQMKSELVRTEAKVEELLEQIRAGNEQYFIVKRRYDALDIEYAQLYEKFSVVEGSG